MANRENPRQPGAWQEAVLVLLRMAIGWHFLYEGLVKVLTPGWTSAPFLAESRWLLSGAFHWIASHPAVLRVVDLLNVGGLVLIGLALLVGAFSRFAAVSGVVLLSLYYVASPPLAGLPANGGAEGSYLIVNKNLVEILALCVVAAFPARGFFGLERALARLFARLRRPPSASAAVDVGLPPARSRRELIAAAAGLPVLGGFVYAVLRKRGFDSYEERLLRAAGADVDAVTSATLKTFQYASLKELKGQVPRSRIGKLEVSRVIMGGNLIGGWAHARDLLYVSQLVKTYHTDRKVFETLRLAEQCGINTFLTNPQLARVINAYWRREGGKIQFFSDCGYKDDVLAGVKLSVDVGATACYVHGGIADNLAKAGKVEVIGRALDLIRQNGLPAGIGAHQLETVQACVDGRPLPGLLGEDPPPLRLLVGAQGRPERQHLVREPRGDGGLHERAAPAVDRVQGPRRRRHPPERGLQVRVPERGRLHLRRDVRLPDRGGRQHRAHRPGRRAGAGPALDRVGAAPPAAGRAVVSGEGLRTGNRS